MKKIIVLIAFISAGCIDKNNVADEPNAFLEPIFDVTEVNLSVLDTEPRQLIIYAKGSVTTFGWKNPTLQAVNYLVPPSDNIYDFNFVAVRPAVSGSPAITPIEARFVLEPMPEKLSGVRIHSANNRIVAQIAQPPTESAYFEFKQSRPEQFFVFKLTNPESIEHARKLIKGETLDEPSIMGKIVSQPADYNPNWSYHLEPTSIRFFDLAIEVCDANMQYVQDHLAEVGGSFLPGAQWCPWNSELTREIVNP